MRNKKNKALKKIIKYLIIFLFVSQTFAFAVDLTFKEKVEEHYTLGQIYYEHGLYDEAEVEFQKALEVSKKIPAEKPKKKSSKRVSRKTIPATQPSNHIENSILDGKEYIIGTGDVLYIMVWDNADLTQEVIVRPDGKISFPLIDEIRALGETISSLDKMITVRLQEYIRHPDVSVSLKEIYGERVVVLGEVSKPGVYKLEGRKTVSEALALAGGYTDDAVLRSVIVIRGGLKNPNAKRVNLAHALERGKFEHDIRVEAKDIVYVPKKFIADVNYYLTQILNPLSRGAVAVNDMTTIQDN